MRQRKASARTSRAWRAPPRKVKAKTAGTPALDDPKVVALLAGWRDAPAGELTRRVRAIRAIFRI
jgi:hypothetical protein